MFKNPVQARLSIFSDGVDIVVTVMRFSYFFTVKYNISVMEEKDFKLYLKTITEKIVEAIIDKIKEEFFQDYKSFNLNHKMN